MRTYWNIAAGLGATLLLLFIILTISSVNLTWRVRGEARDMRHAVQAAQPKRTARIHARDLRGLPEPVQAYLRFTGIVNRIPARAVRLKQDGYFRAGPEGAWMPFQANQYFTTDPPAFLWYAHMQSPPFISVRARDLYHRGRANMLIKLLSLHKIADASGPALDQGAMLRYLSEMIWFPSAFLRSNITWEALDARSARARFSFRGTPVSGVFHFDKQGRFQKFTAMRHMVEDGAARLLPWSAEALEYGEFQGLRLPLRARASWHAPRGDFTYIKFRVTELQYDAPPDF